MPPVPSPRTNLRAAITESGRKGTYGVRSETVYRKVQRLKRLLGVVSSDRPDLIKPLIFPRPLDHVIPRLRGFNRHLSPERVLTICSPLAAVGSRAGAVFAYLKHVDSLTLVDDRVRLPH